MHDLRGHGQRVVCLALSDNQSGDLETCSAARGEWIVNQGTLLRNVFWADNLTAASDTNGAEVFGYNGQIDWHQWAGF